MNVKLLQPHNYQMDIFNDKTRFKVVASGRRFGKDLDLDTEIFTFNRGWTTVGKLEIGDEVVSSNGRPTKVIYLAPIRKCEGYTFTFSTGEKIIASDTHDWVTYDQKERLRKSQGKLFSGIKRTSCQIANSLRTHHKRSMVNHAVPVIPAFVSYTPTTIPIDPYILGAWLRRGHMDKGIVRGSNDAMYNWLIDTWSGETEDVEGRREVELVGLTEKLDKLGVLRNKHIPLEYLQALPAFRLNLLQGIMDADSRYDKSGRYCSITLDDTRLVDDIHTLIVSLGIRCSEPYYVKGTNNRKIVFTARGFNPFSKSNKADRIPDKAIRDSEKKRWIYFNDAEPLEHSRYMRCIGVDSEDHLFAVGRTFVLTHNTELGKMMVCDTVLNGEQVFWFSPTYQMSLQIWGELKDMLLPVTESKSEQARILRTSNGGELRVFSAESYNSIRGLSPKRVIVDECAIIAPLADMWNAAILPSLADKKGEAAFLSTPRGENFFSRLYEMGNDTGKGFRDYKSFSRPTWYNPHIPRQEIIRAKRTTPDKLFQQEYMARFLKDAGDVFIGVTEVTNGFMMHPYHGRFTMGVDLARKNDYTVITVWDMDTAKMVFMDRFSKVDWSSQKTRIKKIYDEWKPSTCYIEDNSIGDVVIDDLRKDGYPVRAFTTTNASKRDIIDRLAVAIQNKQVTLLNDINLITEFQAYQLTISESGNIKYSAPIGYHDDIVMSAAIGFHGVSKGRMLVGALFPKLSIWS